MRTRTTIGLLLITALAAPVHAETFQLGLSWRRDALHLKSAPVQWELDSVTVDAEAAADPRQFGRATIEPFVHASAGRIGGDVNPRIGDRLFRGSGVIASAGAGVLLEPCDACGFFTRFEYRHRRVFGSETYSVPTAGAAVERTRLELRLHEIDLRAACELFGGRVTPSAGVRWTRGDAHVTGGTIHAPLDMNRTELLAAVEVPLGRAWSASLEVARDRDETRPTVSVRYLFGVRDRVIPPPGKGDPLNLDGIRTNDGMLVFDSPQTFDRAIAQLHKGSSPVELETRLAHDSLRADIARRQAALEAAGTLDRNNDPDGHFVQDSALRTVLNRRGEMQVGGDVYVLWDSATTLQIPAEKRSLLDRLRGGAQPLSLVREGANVSLPETSMLPQSACKAGFSVTELPAGYGFVSTAAGVPPLTYHWDFGDGTTASEEALEHSFAGQGPFRVCHTVRDATGCSHTACNWVKACYAQFTATVDKHTATFTPGATTSGFAKEWDFGDGIKSTEENPKHTFAAGNHRVCLTISGAGGCKDTYCDDVTIEQPAQTCCDAHDRVVEKWTTYAGDTRRFKSVLWIRQIFAIYNAWGARTVHYEKNSRGNWRRASAEALRLEGEGILYFRDDDGVRCAKPHATKEPPMTGSPEKKNVDEVELFAKFGSKFWAKSRSLKTVHTARYRGNVIRGPILALSADCARKECKESCTEEAEECKDVCTQEADQCRDVCTQGRSVCRQSCSGGWLRRLVCRVSCSFQSGSCKRDCRKGKRVCKRECRKTKRQCRREC